jgi:hypothetical protein
MPVKVKQINGNLFSDTTIGKITQKTVNDMRMNDSKMTMSYSAHFQLRMFDCFQQASHLKFVLLP